MNGTRNPGGPAPSAVSVAPAADGFDVLVVGAGGLGGPVAMALASVGITRLLVVDDDRVETSNLHRQIQFGDADVGRWKAEVLAERVRDLAGAVAAAPGTERAAGPEARVVRFEPQAAAQLVGQARVVVDASDNFATRFLANDAAVLAGRPLVHGAAIGTGGQILTVPAGGRPCYRCLFEDMPPAGAGDSCAVAGVLGPVPSVVGAWMAAEVVHLLRGTAPAALGRLLRYDAAPLTTRTVSFRANPGCAVCGPTATIHALEPARYTTLECTS